MRLKPADARSRFAEARVVRLATVAPDGAPHLVPVTTAVLDQRVVFAVDHKPKTTLALRRLLNIAVEPRVCFLADGYDEDWSALWWVRVDATARVLRRSAECDEALDALAMKYVQYQQVRPEGPVVSAAVLNVIGWSAASGPPGPQ